MSELISGKEALIAFANGEEVEFEHDIHGWICCSSLDVVQILGCRYNFRIKPRTITINGIDEIPAPFAPQDKEVCFYLDYLEDCGFSKLSFDSKNNVHHKFIQYGAWSSEEDIKQVVKTLHSVFNTKYTEYL